MAYDPFDAWSPEAFQAPEPPDDPFGAWSASDFAPPKRRPATLAALDEEGPNASPPIDRPGDPDYTPLHATARRDMSQLGAGLRAAGAPAATTPAPPEDPLSGMLGLDVLKDTLTGAGRTAVNVGKAVPHWLNQGTSGAAASLGRLARDTGRLLQARPPGGSDAGFLGLGPVLRAPGRAVESLGSEVEGIADRQSAQADEGLKGNPEADSVLGRAVQGVPMLTGLALTGGTTGATAGMGLLGTGSGLKQAEDAGATPGQAWAAGGLQGASDALLGQIGSIPVVRGLLHGVPVSSASEAVLELAKRGGMGALQALGQDLAHGVSRHLTYAKDYGLDPAELAKNAAAQALLQGVLAAPGIELENGKRETVAPRLETSAPPSETVAPFRGTWPDFLETRGMDRSDVAVLTAGGKRALRAEYAAALDTARAEDAAARAAAVPPRPGILAEPVPAPPTNTEPAGGGKLLEFPPVRPDIEAAVDAVAPRLPAAPAVETTPAFPAEVFNRLVEGKPLRLAKTDLERNVGQAARGLWPTGLLKTPADVQLLHDTLAGGGDLDSAVEALAKQAPQKAQRFEPAAPQPPIVQFRQDAAGIEATLPPPAPGMARLWRGKRPGEVGATRFTDDLPGIALPFQKAYGGRLSYVDVPHESVPGFVSAGGPGEFNLPAELAGAAKPVLARGVGSPGTAVTDAGTELPFRYGVVNAPDLVASHVRLGDGTLAPNPDFPAELQPRDRSRAASALQVSKIAAGLDPERLAESRLISQGAPLVGPDGAVESGNARALAIGAAYGTPPGTAYRSWLESQAPRFGLDPAQIRAIDQPVLVRQRLDTPGLDRVRLAQEANQSDVAAMSRAERAAVDAQALTPELLSQYTPNGAGDLASPSNRGFARGFLQRTTSPAELGAMVDPRGQLSQEGQARLHAALLAGAYQDQTLVSRMAEATDDNTRSLSRALATEAPAFIALRQGGEQGSVHPGLDLGPDVAAAANKLSELRATGQRVPEYLAQQGLFGSELSPESQRLLSLFDEFKRTPSRIAETLHRYVELATAAGDPRQASLLPQEPPTKAGLLERAATTWNQAGGLLPFEEPSASSRPEPAAAVADHLAATVPPEHVAAFTPGDSGAAESPTNATATRETVAGLPAVHPESVQAVEGTRGWLLGQALGDQELAHHLTTSKDRVLSRLADPLASVAPSLAEAPPELRGFLRQAVDAYAQVRESPSSGGIFELARLGRLLGAEAPEEVHHIASFLADNADHPETVAQYLHRVAELHQQNGGQTGAEGQLSLSQLLEMAADRDQRQAAGSVIPLESSVPVAKGAVYSPSEAGFVSLRGPRFGEASPIRRWFTREGKFAAMGDDLAARTKDLVNEKDFRVKAASTKVVANVRDFGSALDEQMDLLKHADASPPDSPIGPASSREDVLRYVRAGIQGENDLSAVTPALQDAAMALRAHLDAQSLAYATRPDLPATLRQVIKDNIGEYLPRTFERITDPKGWAKRLREDPSQAWRIEDAAKWAQQQHPDWTPEEAQGYAWKLLMDDPQAAFAIARGTQAQKAGMGSESRGNLKARLGLPEELDNLLGLHADPSRSYQIGAMRAARDLATYDLHSKVAKMGSADPSRPDGLTPDGQRPIFVDRPTPDLPVRIGGKGPLAEKYTSEQVATAMRGTMNVSHAYTGFMRGYMLANGAIKTGKIALNVPMGVMRNMLTWPSLLLAGGHWVNAFPPKYAWETAKALPESLEANLGTREGGVLKLAKRLAYSLPLANGETVGDHLFPQGQKLADLRAEVQRLQEKGILGQSTAADDLRFYTGQTEEPSPGKRVQKVIRDLGGIWSGEHDLGKHIVFASEKANLRWANPDLPVEEIERMAQERTLATTPSRSEVSEGVRAVRAAPGISPFPTFAAERFRNMKNNAMIAWEDLNSTNPRQKILGANRAAGLLTALALAGGGASKMLQVLWGTAKEDADALREFLAEYASTHQIAVADRTGGKIRYADISPQMPLTGVTDPAMALLRCIHEGSTRDGMVDAAEELARPFMDPEFALKAGLDVYRNQEFRGNPADALLDLAREHPRGVQERPVYLKGGPPGVVAGQIGRYVWHTAGPAMGLEAERIARATGVLSNTNARGKRYTVADEMAALNGVRFNTIDMNAALTSVGYDLKDALTESKRYFTGERSSSQNDPKTVLDARAAANERWKNAFEIGLKKVAAARQLRIPDYAIRQNLRISGVPPIVIGQLMTGRFSALPLRMPYRMPRDYVGAGMAPEGGDEE